MNSRQAAWLASSEEEWFVVAVRKGVKTDLGAVKDWVSLGFLLHKWIEDVNG